jgi:hypothetical protein
MSWNGQSVHDLIRRFVLALPNVAFLARWVTILQRERTSAFRVMAEVAAGRVKPPW